MSEFQLYLASASPRRRELLDQLGVTYQLLHVDVDESTQAGESPAEYALRVAAAKALAGQAMLGPNDKPVLGADTAVVVDGQVFGKPHDRADALHMLQQLSGRSHQVLSAVAVAADELYTELSVSEVTFRQLSEAEIEAYWQTGECRDKAGAYAIQGRAALFISQLSGSYSGVMGLPLYETGKLLKKVAIDIFSSSVS